MVKCELAHRAETTRCVWTHRGYPRSLFFKCLLLVHALAEVRIMSDLQQHPNLPLNSLAGRLAGLLLLGAMLSGCATYEPLPRYEQTVTYPARELTSPQVYSYPAAGQSSAQQDRDRYECHVWAVKQTGFDPGSLRSQRSLQVESVAQPEIATASGEGAAVGAVTGALLGAAVSRPRHAGEGALLGAIAGAVIGAVSDSERQERAEAVQQHYVQRDSNRYNARLDRQIRDYRRAMSACLAGRNYEVQ